MFHKKKYKDFFFFFFFAHLLDYQCAIFHFNAQIARCAALTLWEDFFSPEEIQEKINLYVCVFSLTKSKSKHQLALSYFPTLEHTMLSYVYLRVFMSFCPVVAFSRGHSTSSLTTSTFG